jgi:hypothetical protein
LRIIESLFIKGGAIIISAGFEFNHGRIVGLRLMLLDWIVLLSLQLWCWLLLLLLLLLLTP